MRAAARRRDDDHGNLAFGRLLDEPRQFLADDRAHAGAEETEIHNRQRNIVAVDLAQAGHDGVVQPGLSLIRAQPFAVGRHTGKLQHIHARHVGIELAKCAFIHQQHDPLGSGHREMVIAFAADLGVVAEFLAVNHLATVLALDPQTAGDLVPLGLGFGNLRFFFFFEYRHARLLVRRRRFRSSPPLQRPKL